LFYRQYAAFRGIPDTSLRAITSIGFEHKYAQNALKTIENGLKRGWNTNG
jgi:hypothetical protein